MNLDAGWKTRLAQNTSRAVLCSAAIYLFYKHIVQGWSPFSITYVVAGFALLLAAILWLAPQSRFLPLLLIVGLGAIGIYSQTLVVVPALAPAMVLVAALAIATLYYRLWSVIMLGAIAAAYATLGYFAHRHPQAGQVFLPPGVATLSEYWLNSGVAFFVVGLILAVALSYVINALERAIADRDRLLKKSEEQKQQLAQREQLLQLFTQLASDYVYQVDLTQPNLLPEIYAGAFERTTGYTRETLEQKGGWLNVVHPADRAILEQNLPRLLAGESVTSEYRIITAQGKTRWLRDQVQPVRDPATGAVAKLLGAVTDITEQKNTEAQLENLAFYDPLTSLPNRRLLLDRLEQAIALSARTGQHAALLLVDLDHFKDLNDTRGYEAGDELLVLQARRLVRCVRPGDTVARLGGDDFIVVLGELDADAQIAADTAAEIARTILNTLSLPVALTGRGLGDYEGTCSIGIALFRGSESSVEEILRRAEVAMYQAKSDGRNLYRFYDVQMQRLLAERIALLEDLRRALAEKQFRLFLQPQFDSQQRVIGAEALLRWLHPTRGWISPLQFIPIAEHSGLIVEIGNWVLEEACHILRRWQDGPATARLTLAVNVSARQFRQESFVGRLKQILQTTGARPEMLKLELTESLALENIEDTVAKMQELHELGIGLALDDFGTGHSSLSYLRRLPLHELKIDQVFVRDIPTDPNDTVLVQTIIGMAQNLRLATTAEGVETAEQLEFLKNNGCMFYQGFLFSPPLPQEEFEQRFAA